MPKTKTIKNEPDKFDKVNKSHRRVTFAAIVMALLIHGLLLVLFKYEPPAPVYKTTGSPGVSFMSLGSLKTVKQQQLQNWLEYHEPSMISAPHSKYGYSQLIPHASFRSTQADQALKLTKSQMPPVKVNEFKELQTSRDFENDIFSNYILHPPQLKLPAPIEKKVEIKPPAKYPLLKANGKLLELSLSPELLKKAANLKVKEMEINYRPGPDKLFPRITVFKSSGNRNFDMAVLHELSIPFASILEKNKGMTVTIKWRATTIGEEAK